MADPTYPDYMPSSEVEDPLSYLPDYQNPDLNVDEANRLFREQGLDELKGKYDPLKPSTRKDALLSTLSHDNLIGSIAGAVNSGEENMWFTADSSFDITKHDDLFEGLDLDYYEYLASAKSLEHAQFLSNKYKKATNNKAYLDDLGWEGVLYQTGALLGDVPLLSLVTKLGAAGKLGNAFVNMNKSYTGRVILTGATEGAFEIAKKTFSDRERTEMDLLFAVVGGGVFGGIYNPLKYDQQMQTALREAMTDTIESQAARVAGEPLSLASRAREKINSVQFDITSIFEQSPSVAMKSIGDRLFLNVLKKNTDEIKGIQVRDQVATAITAAFNTNFQPLYLGFMKTLYGKGVIKSRFSQTAESDFFEMASDLFYGKKNPLIDKINQADPSFVPKLEEAFTKMSGESHDILRRAGHEKFVSGAISKTDDYMPLRWLRDNIKQRTTAGEFTKANFKALVRKSLESQLRKSNIVLDKERIKKAANKFTATMYKADLPKGKNIIVNEESAMKRAVDELGDMLDLTEAEMKLLRGEATARKAPSKSAGSLAASTRFRTPLDLNTKITLQDGSELAISDFVESNMQMSWKRYGNTMGGDTALRLLGFADREAIQKTRSQIEKELIAAQGVSKQETNKYLTAFDATIDHLLGRSSKTDPDGLAWRRVRTANNLVRSAALGGTWFSMATEVARLTHANGVSTMIKTVPALRDIFKAYRGKNPSAVFDEIRLHEALGAEIGQSVSSQRYDDILGKAVSKEPEGFGENLERFSDLAAEATGLVGGFKSGTALLEYWGAIAARSKMLRMAEKGLDKKAYRYFEQYGFGKDTADEIADQIRRFSNKDKNYPLLNLDAWDAGLGQRWSLGVRRRSHELVQRANFGDQVAIQLHGNLIGDTVTGSLALGLKSYLLTAYRKQLSKGLTDLSRGGDDMLDTIGNWTYQTAFASVAYTAKMYSIYGFDEKKLDEVLTPAMIAKNTFSMTTFSSFLPGAIDLASEAVADQPVFNTYGGRGSNFAVEGFAKNVIGAGQTITNMLSPWAEASRGEVRKGLATLPLSNAIGMNMLFYETSKAFGD